MNIKFLFVLLVNMVYSQSKQIVICDSEHNSPIANVSIDFMNGYGVYSNEDGFVDYNVLPDRFIVSHLSYKDSILNKSEIKDSILLKSKNLILKEVFLTKRESSLKLKQKSKIAKNHGDFTKTIFPSVGLEFCFFIDNDGHNNSFLKLVTIPIINKSFEFKDGKQKLVPKHFKDLIAINVYSSKDYKPYECLPEFSFTKVIDSDHNDTDFTIELNEISIPSEGLFVSVKFMGNVDDEDRLIVELPYKKNQYKDEIRKISKNLMPLIPLIEMDNARCFLRYEFSESNNWLPISEYNFKIKNQSLDQKSLGIDIGYKIIYNN
ncbi:hypothetical protein [Flavobacterium sp. J27]|uniref:hypothetical protein n=1 Tax=Flavobacterium sp. J27 TaxID=2060419 RepID=UPI00102F7EE0|nr:hypothetical protein [Flavobacterium sp. J27]